MIRGDSKTPAVMCATLVELGFESIEPFFWQTMDADLPQLAREIKEAIGDSDVTIDTLGMFGNPLEETEIDRRTLAGWEALIDNAHLFGAKTVAGFTGRIRGKPIEDSLPRYKAVWGALAKRAADKGVQLAFENCAMDGNWASGDWNIAHNPDAWELMFNALPARKHRARMGALPPARLSHRSDPANPQMGVEILPCARQGRDRALGRHSRTWNLRQSPFRSDAQPRFRRQRLDAHHQRIAAGRL